MDMLPQHDPLFMARYFPAIRSHQYRITSPYTTSYNCIAWAADVDSQWWQPGMYWPTGVAEENTLNAYIDAYRTIGYEICADGTLEDGYEKICIYIDGNGIPTHASKQLDDTWWKSKLGRAYDIEHVFDAFTGSSYGQPNTFMRRDAQK